MFYSSFHCVGTEETTNEELEPIVSHLWAGRSCFPLRLLNHIPRHSFLYPCNECMTELMNDSCFCSCHNHRLDEPHAPSLFFPVPSHHCCRRCRRHMHHDLSTLTMIIIIETTELTVLGFLSLLSFVATKLEVLGTISKAVFGEDEEDKLEDLLEGKNCFLRTPYAIP